MLKCCIYCQRGTGIIESKKIVQLHLGKGLKMMSFDDKDNEE